MLPYSTLVFQRSTPRSWAPLRYQFAISSLSSLNLLPVPSVSDWAHPATRVELLMPREAERWFHCIFRCGDGWLSEAARGVLARRVSVVNKYTCPLLMHRATLTAMQINHSPPPYLLPVLLTRSHLDPHQPDVHSPQNHMRLSVWSGRALSFSAQFVSLLWMIQQASSPLRRAAFPGWFDRFWCSLPIGLLNN